MTDFRIGFGQDIHSLTPGRDFILGGVKIPFEKGLEGHSDADALLHALMDAILGALALGDIGELFPNTDPAYRGISSMKLLSDVVAKVKKLGYTIVNVDSVIHCEKPRIAPFKNGMRNSIARALGIDQERVSIKAGTNEGFDSVGEGKAVVCQAIVLLKKKNRGKKNGGT